MVSSPPPNTETPLNVKVNRMERGSKKKIKRKKRKGDRRKIGAYHSRICEKRRARAKNDKRKEGR